MLKVLQMLYSMQKVNMLFVSLLRQPHPPPLIFTPAELLIDLSL